MAKTGRLAIYDSADSMIANIGRDRDADARIGVDSVAKLGAGLDQLVASRQQFKRVVFDTHGSEGKVWLGNEAVSSDTWRTQLKGKGYERLFPFFSKMYFSGCNVSDDDVGWSFLEAASETFFAGLGGVTMAYTSLGLTTRWGHFNPKHFWGELRLVISMPGKKPRRVSGGDILQLIVHRQDKELLWVLKQVDIL